MDWSLWISSMALIGSAYTYLKHDRRIKRQEELLNAYSLKKFKDEEVEQKRAAINAIMTKHERGKRVFELSNSGKSIARNVNLKIEPEIRFLSNPFPLEFINPRDSIELIAVVHKQSPDKITIEFVWDDDSEMGRTNKQVFVL